MTEHVLWINIAGYFFQITGVIFTDLRVGNLIQSLHLQENNSINNPVVTIRNPLRNDLKQNDAKICNRHVSTNENRTNGCVM